MQVKVAPEFAEYLEEVRDALNEELDLRLGIPDVTRVLLRTKDDPRVVVAIEKRSGRGGRRLVTPVLPDLL